MSWRVRSKNIASRGSNSAKAVSLADLHRRRNETSSQYFTPEWVARGIWHLFKPYLTAGEQSDKSNFSVLDNSIGSGMLFEGAPVEKLSLFGIDTDARCIEALSDDAHAADLDYEFLVGSMADLRAKGFDFAVINPPFSLQLESPNLIDFGCNSFGPFGKGTSALSHEYALEHALSAARFVAAVLPASMEAYCRSKERLLHIVHLPQTAFCNEGANIKCAVFFFAKFRNKDEVQSTKVSMHDVWPTYQPDKMHGYYWETTPTLSLADVDNSEPVITLPVTGNNRVELHHSNRRITLKYHCGLVQAKVANGLLRRPAEGKRLPANLKHEGEGRFLLDVLLLQNQPEHALQELVDEINTLGGSAWISPTLRGFYTKLIKRHARAITPMRRVVKTKSVGTTELRARRSTLLEPGNFKSPTVSKGDQLRAKPLGGAYEITHKGQTVTLRRDEVTQRYEIMNDERVAKGQWVVKEEGLPFHFPQLAQQYESLISRTGINWLADFQKYSVVEGLISPYGYIGGWQQGSGKARYALAMALLEPGRSLIVVESGLLPEMLKEIKKIGLQSQCWRVLKKADMPTTKISIVTYRELRSGSRISYSRTLTKNGELKTQFVQKVVRTAADRWRRLFRTVLVDEGGVLANNNTQQTRAIRKLAGRKVIPLDGTPQYNYPRDLLPISEISAGNGTAHQPYGVRGRGFVQPKLSKTTINAQRGEDAFFDNHVVTQWVTNEFREDLQSGGKREVPKINNLSMFRDWLAPNLQRRLREEPELSEFNNCPEPERNVCPIEWDPDHFDHYLKVATEFSDWYKKARDSSDKALNLVTVLARIGAVQRAANAPHVKSKNTLGTFQPLTSKQRWALDRIKYWTAKGKKTILYAEAPDVLERLHSCLEPQGISSVLFTGKQEINKRSKILDDEFRHGDTPVLLSSWVGQRGLNLEQAGVILFYERAWSATKEEQAIYRTQRPSQTQHVQVEYGHLAGSIDIYQAQLVEWKKTSAEAGLDYGEQMDDEEEFLHLDTLLNRFCEEIHQMSPIALQQQAAA
ncbi:helicase-related protein [Pseudovibrio sp. Ad37]|uniref:helicase-related protein n=1 Tax=Pseudovibrio sp. Ad37 TaxID=989422 RepID=UPI0007AE73A5|nr:helicase-related protein [Pseudovibrio sp. Ad37]KZL22677.1 ATP-dependent RNA helicase RhlB [Pseudovibrio sp. Ad37]